MKASKFLDLLRVYPDLEVDIVVKDGNKLLDVNDIVCDERNGNLIITTENEG